MSEKLKIKKPTLVWVIVGFAVTLILFLTSLDVIEDIWYLYVMFIMWDIGALMQYFGRKKAYNKMLNEAEGITEDGSLINSVKLATPATIKVVRDSSIVGAIVPYNVYLNSEFIGKIRNGKTLEIPTSVSHNIVMVFDNQENSFLGDFVVDLEDEGYAEVHVKAGRLVKTENEVVKKKPPTVQIGTANFIDPTVEVVKKKRPTAITVICILGFIGAAASIPMIFSDTVRVIWSWYPLYLGLSCVIGFVCMVGLWQMKKWAAYTYTGFVVLNQIVLLAMGVWNVGALLFPAIVVGIALANVKKMS